ncbi:MAG: hypothetical protein ACP5P1_13080 [Acidimicrobiales bacterium]
MSVRVHCPWCDFAGSSRSLQQHFDETHPDMVAFPTRGSRSFYAVTCPSCDSAYEQEIKPRYNYPGFLEEYRNEIRLVAFDMLVNHIVAEHTDLDSTIANTPEDP